MRANKGIMARPAVLDSDVAIAVAMQFSLGSHANRDLRQPSLAAQALDEARKGWKI